MNRVEEALKAASETRALRVGCGILSETPDLFKQLFSGKRAVVVADDTTYRIAGERVVNFLKENQVEQDEPFVFHDADLYAEYSFIDRLVNFLKATDAIPIAVGSGTINDLTKLASHLSNRRYMCVATAASMDGYTAFGASITAKGAKQTFSCPAPMGLIADIDIISTAPREMTASGYADLFAKVTAGADWILADRLGVEAIEPKAWSIVQDGLHDALSNPSGASAGEEEAIRQLIEGLLLGGFAMQWSKSSRPASGAEHQFSHLWNMEHHLNNGEHISHGFQVSIGMLAVAAFYEQVLDTDFTNLDVESCCNAWPEQSEIAKEAEKMFLGTDFPTIGVTETGAKYVDKSELKEELMLLKKNWNEIRVALQKQLIPFKEIKKRLQEVGAPIEPEQIGISRARLRSSFIMAQYIRRRFTVLDLAVRTGNMEKWLDGLFGEKGVWKITE